MENAAVVRLESRIKEVTLEEAKQQMQHHLEETREQQNRLVQLIQQQGGTPVKDDAELPSIKLPRELLNTIKRSMTDAEYQLKGAKEDLVIEYAEATTYDALLQLAQLLNTPDAIPVLTQNLSEERTMADWIRANTPAMVSQLFPAIQSSLSQTSEEPAGASAAQA